MGEQETMDKDSSLPTEIPLLLTELVNCTRTEDTGRYTLPNTNILYLVKTDWADTTVGVFFAAAGVVSNNVKNQRSFAINYTFIHRISATTRSNTQKWFQAPESLSLAVKSTVLVVHPTLSVARDHSPGDEQPDPTATARLILNITSYGVCLLYTSDAADD